MRSGSDLVHQRLQGLLELSDEALIQMPDSSTEHLVLAGVKAQCITWHEARSDGSHWIFVELWDTQLINRVLAAEGFALSGESRRPLTSEELNGGR